MVTVATGGRYLLEGRLDNITVSLGKVAAHSNPIVFPNVPFDVVIGRPTIKRLGEVLDLREEEVSWTTEDKNKLFPWFQSMPILVNTVGIPNVKILRCNQMLQRCHQVN